MTPSNNLLTAYVRWLIQHRIFMLVVSVVVTLAIGGGALQLSVTNDMRSFFGKDNPQLEAFEKLESVYERLDNLVFVVEATGDADLFSKSGLSLIHELTERSWQAPYSRRVDSLTNYQHTRAEGDNLIVGPLVEDLETLDRRAIAEIKRIALSEPFLVNQVLGKSGEGAWVSVALTLPDGATEANIEVEAWATQLADELRAAYPQFQILIGGTAYRRRSGQGSATRHRNLSRPQLHGDLYRAVGSSATLYGHSRRHRCRHLVHSDDHGFVRLVRCRAGTHGRICT